MDAEAVNFHLNLLGSRELYHCVAKNHANGKTANAWLQKFEIFTWAKQRQNEGYTVWISLNDKEQGNDTVKGVCALCDFWLDIDSKREAKNVPATEAELQEALNRAAKLKEYIEITYGAVGFMANSGNGFHVHFPLPRFELVGEQFRVEINEKVKSFAKNVAATVKAEIDHTYDIRRVTTLIGTLNLKIPEHPLETRWDKEIFTEGYEQAVGYVDRARELNKALLEAILNVETKCQTATYAPSKEHVKLDALLSQDAKLFDLFKGDWQKYGYKSRSEAEQAVLTKLVLEGFSDEEINEAMEQCNIGKWQEKADSYRTVSIKHAREQAQKYIAEKNHGEKTPVMLEHLNLIEDPQLTGKPVVVEAVVSSNSIAYLAPTEVTALTKQEDGDPAIETRDIDAKALVNIQVVGVSVDTKFKRLERLFKPKSVLSLNEDGWRTVYLTRVRPPVFTLEKRGEKIVDEKGFEYKAFDIYVTADQPITFQPSGLIKIEGLAVPNPRTQKTTLLAYKVEFPEATHSFDTTAISLLKSKFEGKTVRERLDWILDNFQSFSQIVGRRNLATAVFLTFFTPTWIRFNGEIQRGWGNNQIIGDTTTAKSETVRKAISLLKAGVLITAETASTVGLTGTATQVEREGWFVDWGFLVLSDRKLLAVDGAHKLSLSNWAALAEAERSGVVSIAKAAKNTAYARTRQIKIANAVDKEADKYSTKSLATFLYQCQALTTILDKTSIARLDLAVFADQRDVPPAEINKRWVGNYDKDLEMLSEALKWCWSDTAKVEFTSEAEKLVLEKATELYDTFFCEMIPLASIDLKWKLARLSAALAYLTLSTEDFQTVTVTKDHVEVIADFIEQEYSKAGLNILAQETRFERLDITEVKAMLLRIEAATEIDYDKIVTVLKYIVTHGRITKAELMQKFSLAEKNEARPLLAALTSEGLIKISRGFYPEPKLIEAYKVTGGFVSQ